MADDEHEPRLILGKDNDNKELVVKEKRKYNRATFVCPPSLSAKQAGKMVADLSKMEELFSVSRNQQPIDIPDLRLAGELEDVGVKVRLSLIRNFR